MKRTELWVRDDGWEIRVDVDGDTVHLNAGDIKYTDVVNTLHGRGYALPPLQAVTE